MPPDGSVSVLFGRTHHRGCSGHLRGQASDPEVPRTVNFAHSLSRILTAAIEAGLTIRTFEEFDRAPWQAFPQLVKADEFYWRLPAGLPFFPLSFALTAERGT